MMTHTPHALPTGWVECTLGEIAEWGSGGTPRSGVAEFYNGEIPWLIIGDLTDGLVQTADRKITEMGLRQSSAKMVKPYSVLLAMYGSIGKLGINTIEVATNQAIAFTQFLPSGILNWYLFYYLMASRNNFFKLAKGGTQQNISQTVIKAFPFPLPPLNEQRRIVAKIEALFSELENGVVQLSLTQAKLKQYRQALLKTAFNGNLTADWRAKQNSPHVERSETSPHLSQDDEGGLPVGWELRSLGEVVSKRSEKQMPTDTPEQKYIGMDCIAPHTLKPFFFYKCEEFKSAGNVFYKDDFLYGRLRPYLNKTYVATFDGVASGEFIVLKCKNSIYPIWLQYLLFQQIFVKWSNAQAAGDKPRVKFDQIALYSFPLPPLPEQEEIVKRLEAQFSVIDAIEAEIMLNLQKAETLKQAILQKAFAGQLVPQDPTDEPASELLKRIQSEKEMQAKIPRKKKATTA